MTMFSALGAGNMANAILAGAVSAGYLSPGEVGTYNVHEEKREAMAAKGYRVYRTIGELCRESRYILADSRFKSHWGREFYGIFLTALNDPYRRLLSKAGRLSLPEVR